MTDPDAFDPSAPTHELISFALSHPDDEEWGGRYWEVVSLLHKRGTRDIFEAATRLLASPCPIERALGADLHAQLGYEQNKPFAAESVRLLSALLGGETDPHVIYSALIALGHLYRPACVPVVIGFANHPDEDIRYAVAFALPLAGDEDERAVATLIALTADSSTKVRDWATFALGSQTECDTPEVRAALWARLSDSDSETRGEALKGLALRKVEGTDETIIAELRGPDPHEYAIEAAEELADPRLVPALEVLRGGPHAGEWLEGIIETCHGASNR